MLGFRHIFLSCALALAGALPLAAQSLSDMPPPAEPIVPVEGAPTGFEELADRLMPSVVNIITTNTVLDQGLPQMPQGSPLERYNEFFGRDPDGFRREGALGSGFVISPEGLIVTNDHVIRDADEIEVVFSDNRQLPAEVIGTDPDTDIALLKVDAPRDLPYVEFGDSDKADVGSWVIAIGNPFGFGGSVSAGIVSARSRDINAGAYDDFIQTDAAINRGNSGGPLFNMRGEVIGVNTAIYSQTGGSVGIGFSVPSNLAADIVDALRDEGRVRRGWLGVNIQGVDEGLAEGYGLRSARGVIVNRITDGSPAAEAGLEVGDLILEINGEIVEDSRGLTRSVAAAPIGEPVAFEILRAGRARTLEITLRERETDNETEEEIEPPVVAGTSNALGVDLVAMSDELRRRYDIPRGVDGAVVDRVNPRGPSAGKLRRGDVILAVNFEVVSDLEAALGEIEAAEAEGRPAVIHVKRQGRDAFFSVDME